MKRYSHIWRNKYVFTGILFALYMLFLDDVDIFSIARYQRKLNQLERQKREVSVQLEQTKETLLELQTLDGKERFAREKKYFKRDNEDVFVISYE